MCTSSGMTRSRRAIALLALLSLPLLATTMVRASLDDLILKSSAIVRGKIVSSQPVTRGSVIYTAIQIRVTERLKGTFDTTAEVWLPGGVSGGLKQSFAGVPQLSPDTEYVFFLWTGRNKVTQLLGLSQGVLELTRNAQGEWIVGRGASDAVMLDSSGNVVKDQAFTMRLNDLTSRIHTMVGGGAGR
jgi:hypothetical protein